MRIPSIFVLLLAAGVLQAADWKPAKAIVNTRSSEPQELFILTITRDKMRASQNPEMGYIDLNFRDVREIEWIELDQNIDYARGLGDLNSGRYDRAIERFQDVLDVHKQILFVRAHEGMATAYERQEQYGKAVESLRAIEQELPQWPWLLDILYRIGELQIAAGDLDAAEATFSSIAQRQAVYGESAVSMSLLGRASVLVERGDNVGAAELLARAFEGISAEEDPRLRGRIGVLLAEQQQAAGKTDTAKQTLQAIQYLPIEPDDLSSVHAQLADIALEAGELETAFDHAVFGVLVPDASGSATRDARAVARKARNAIEESDTFSDEDKLAYRQAYDKL
ncbi:MAG: tetratricopeptide repeat protein [Planctomycetota bacterium]